MDFGTFIFALKDNGVINDSAEFPTLCDYLEENGYINRINPEVDELFITGKGMDWLENEIKENNFWSKDNYNNLKWLIGILIVILSLILSVILKWQDILNVFGLPKI